MKLSAKLTTYLYRHKPSLSGYKKTELTLYNLSEHHGLKQGTNNERKANKLMETEATG